MSVNKAIILGHVGNDPQVRVLESGTKCATFPIATTERGYTAKNGQQVPDQTTWHNIVVWKGLAEIVEKYVRKGSPLYLEGKITNRKYTGRDGIERYASEIIADKVELLSSSKAQPERQEPLERASSAQASAQPAANPVNNQEEENPFGEPPDDMPF